MRAHHGAPPVSHPRIDIDKDLLRETLKHFNYYDVSDEDLENVYARIAELESVPELGDPHPNRESSLDDGNEHHQDGDSESAREFKGTDNQSEKIMDGKDSITETQPPQKQELEDDALAIDEMLRTEEEESVYMRERNKKREINKFIDTPMRGPRSNHTILSGIPRTSGGQPLVNNKGEYLHHQRFKPFIGLEKKIANSERHSQDLYDNSDSRPQSARQRQSDIGANMRPLSQRTMSASTERSAHRLSERPPFDNNFPYPDPNDNSRHISRYTKESCFGTVPRLLTSLPPNRHVLSRTASNVIYAHTDDRAYCSSSRGRPTPYCGFYQMSPQMYTSRTPQRRTDLVKKGAQMRKSWDKDNFLTQKNRKDELWEVRRSMLEYRPPINVHNVSL